jgi:hypothetical protein
VDHRRDDVARRIVVELEDELAEVGLQRLDADVLQIMQQVRLLRHHALGLDAGPAAFLLRDAEADGVGLLGVVGEMDGSAGRGGVVDELPEVVVEVLQRVLLDAAGKVAHRVVPLAEHPGGVFLALGVLLQRRGVDELLNLRVGDEGLGPRVHVVRQRGGEDRLPIPRQGDGLRRLLVGRLRAG